MKKLHAYLLLAAVIGSMIPAFQVRAQESTTVEIQPDGAAMKDTTITAQSPNLNEGNAVNFNVGEINTGAWTTRALLEFDLSGLPRDVIVESAVLELTVRNDFSSNTRTMNAYAINTDWSENTATWSVRKDFLSWQTAGAGGENDVVTTPIGTVSVPDNLTDGSKVTITITDLAAVAAMFKQNYFGFKLQMETESNDLYDFYSSDSTTATNRPKLTITYTSTLGEVIDPGWICVNVSPYLGCNEAELVTEKSPYTSYDGVSDPTYIGYSGGVHTRPVEAAKMLCEPYPRCVNDYPVYYRFEYVVDWNAWGNTNGNLSMLLDIPGGTDIVRSAPCGTGVHGQCRGVFEGEIPMQYFPPDYDAGFTIGVATGVSFPSTWPVSGIAIGWEIYLSLQPFDQNCAETWYVPVVDTYEINPMLETPLGMNGTPADDQIYPTVVDQTYMVRVEDGPWNDGTNDRTDAAVSFDGVTWMTWEEFSTYAICIDVSSTNPEDDYRIIYFVATTETFHIRVNDEAGQFADNTNNQTTPYQYAIGIAFQLAGPTSCESQFTYGPEDTIASVTVHGTSEDTPVNNDLTEPIEPGLWYAIEVANGSWSEDTPVTERIDMEFSFESETIGANVDWQDLAEGSDLVYCVSSEGNIVFIQSPSGDELILHLRVNDQDTPQNFSDNTGTLGVNVYKTTFNRRIDGCELQFDIGSLVYSDEVEASASNGKAFATVLSTGGIVYGYGLTPGAWYMLETTGGPWWQTFTGGGYNVHEHYYDIKLKSELTEWVIPDAWPLAECVVTVDALGHQRIYFQTPENGIYYIKVGGAGPFGRGSMGWDLYEAIDLELPPGNCDDYEYNPDVTNAIGEIEADLDDGQYIAGLENGEYFAIQIESANTASDPPYFDDSGWYESEGGEERDDLELTIDGTTWTDLPDSPAVLCYFYTPESNELVFFVRVVNGQTWKMRANSESFSDNVGKEIYRTHLAGNGPNPWITCLENNTPTVPAINEHEWIPPQDEEGIVITADMSYVDGNVLPDGWLESGHSFLIETKEGPWYDRLPPDAASYLAQLSSDGGETWYLFDEHPDVICSNEDQLGWYWQAIFTVTEGQKWKIRVADTETEVFTDNSGSLAYRLQLVNEFPEGGTPPPGTGPGTGLDVCTQALIRPPVLTLSEIGSLGNYIGDWIQYSIRSMLGYFAWCPRHTDLLLSAINVLKTKEPLATIEELDTIRKTVAAEVESYNWEGGYDDTSIFNARSSGDVERIFENIIPQSGPGTSPWEEGGDLVHFTGNSSLPPYYYTCDNVFADYLPSRLRTGVCFTSAYWKETGASFWVQVSLDIGAIFLLIRMIKGALQSLIYMMTGVRPWTRDGAHRMIVEVASGNEIVRPVDEWRTSRR